MKVSINVPIVFLAACVTAPARVVPIRCPPDGIAAASVRPPADQPTPVTTFRPPMPVPPSVRGRPTSIRLVVDTAGRVMPDSITICGLSDAVYINQLAQSVAAVRFVPARPGVAVAGATQIGFLIR